MSTSVLLTDIVNERQHRERLLALIAISSLVGSSVKKMTCLALIMTFPKSIPLLNTILMQTEICCGVVSLTFTAASPKWKQELAIRGLKSCCCWKLSVFLSLEQHKTSFSAAVFTPSLERSSRQIKAVKRRRCVFLHMEQHQPLL